MVERLFQRIAAPVRGLHQAAYVLALLTLASQALALLRDRTFAHIFGAGHTLDLYYAAFRVPDLVFALVSSLVSAYVLIPRIAGGSQGQTRELISETTSFLIIGGGIICLVLGIFAPTLLALLYPALAGGAGWASFVLLARILLIQPILLGISGVITSVTQVHRRFLLFAISPVLYNLGIIAGAVFLFPRYGLPGIGLGVVIGAALHAAIHIPVIREAGVFPKLMIPRIKVMFSIMKDSVPRSLALGMSSFTALVLTSLASRVGTGSISVFTLAGNLEAVPLALIGGSYAVAAFPALSESAGKDPDAFARILSASARHIIVWSMVFLGLIAILRAHIVRVILGSGAFDWNATRLTAALLAIFTAGLIAQGLILLFQRALYAAHQSWRPLIYQAVGGAFTICIALAFLSLDGAGTRPLETILRVRDIPGTMVLTLAIASTLGQIFLALWSLAALHRKAPSLARSLAEPLFEGTAAAIAGGLAAYGTLYIGGDIAPLTTTLSVFTQGFIAGIVGLAASAATLSLLKNEEFGDIVNALARLAPVKAILPPSAPEEPANL